VVIRRLVALLLCFAPPVLQAQGVWNPSPGGQSFTIRSEALGESRDVFVMRPRSTGSDTARHQVMVLLDGDGMLPPAAGLTTFLQLSSGHAPWLLVAVRSVNPDDRLRNFTPAPDSATRARYPLAGGSERFRRFLESELRPFVEARFPTGARWALVGHSLAGVFVVDALARPEVRFTDFVAISPTLGWQGGAVGVAAAERATRPSTPSRLFLSTADEGPRYPPDATRRLDAELSRAAQRHLMVTLHHFAGEDHVSTVPPSLHAALRWLSSARGES
jgi:uncharacterized protein